MVGLLGAEQFRVAVEAGAQHLVVVRRLRQQVGALVSQVLLDPVAGSAQLADRAVDIFALLLEIEKTLVEGAGAAGLAALLKDPARFAGKKIGLVLCGGNIDPLLLAAILERGMVRAGRLARIRVAARDTPGVLARITAVVAEAGANIDEVHHQRAFSTLSVQSVEVELVLQTRNRAHVQDVVARLVAAGFEAISD